MKIFSNDSRTNGCSVSFIDANHNRIQQIHGLDFINAIAAVPSMAWQVRFQFIGPIAHLVLSLLFVLQFL